MKNIIIGGGSGLVGSRLVQLLDQQKYKIYVLSRSKKVDSKISYLVWDPINHHIDLEGVKPDIIINLTGAGIADQRWTAKRKKVLIESRVKSTEVFGRLIQDGTISPETFISASAVGIYGDRGDELLTEDSALGDMDEFMVECCAKWESAVDQLSSHIAKIVKLRIGIVVSSRGGALSKLSLPTRLGGAGYFGNGKQYMPWIHIDDLCKMIIQSIENDEIAGVYNAVSPTALQAKTFMQQLKMVYRKWALVLPIPAFFIKTAMGEMSKVMLNSNRVVPQRFSDLGFKFDFPQLTEAIADVEARRI